MSALKTNLTALFRNGLYNGLLFLLFWEWLRPLFTISKHTELYIIEPFLVAIAAFLIVDSFALPLSWKVLFKLYIGLQTVSYFFRLDLPFRLEGWNTLFATWAADIQSGMQGEWMAVSAESRTLMFLEGWALLTYAVRIFTVERYRILWFTAITFIYLMVLEVLGQAPVGYAYLRVLFVGMLLQALLGLPRIGKAFDLNVHVKNWTWKWLLISVCFVTALAGAGALLSLSTADVGRASAWDKVARNVLQDYSLDIFLWPVESMVMSALSHRSGYGEDDRELGGSVWLSDEIIFVAKTDQITYWRGESKSVYTGKGWESPPRADPVKLRVEGLSQPNQLMDQLGYPDHADYPDHETRSVVQEVMFPKASPASSMLFVGGQLRAIHEVRSDDVHGNSERRVSSQLNEAPDIQYDREGEAWSLAQSGELTYYKVSVAVPDEAALPQSIAPAPPMPSQAGSALAQLREEYTRLPGTVPERIQLLARRITAHADNEWDKAVAIQSYLRKHYEYRTNGIGYPAEHQDFVDHFLFDTKAGYCDHFSTAMVVLLRAADVPARWVKGFSPGEAVYLNTESLYEVTVRAEHAHAWAEVYAAGMGWLPIEATPGFGLDGFVTAPATASAQTELPYSVEENGGHHLLANMWYAVALLLAVVPFIRPLYRQCHKLSKRVLQTPRERLLQHFDIVWRKIFRQYGPMAEHQTVREYVQMMSEQHNQKEQEFLEFIRMYENVRYGSFRYVPYGEQDILEISKKLLRTRQSI